MKKRYIIVIVCMLFVVAGCGQILNTSPKIIGIHTSTENITPGETISIECEVVDNDSDQLTFTWTKSAGEISGSGSTIEWTAPEEEQTVNISVSVSDGNTVDSETIEIKVEALNLFDNTLVEDILINGSSIKDFVYLTDPNSELEFIAKFKDPDNIEGFAWGIMDIDTGQWDPTVGKNLTWTAGQTKEIVNIALQVVDKSNNQSNINLAIFVNDDSDQDIDNIKAIQEIEKLVKDFIMLYSAEDVEGLREIFHSETRDIIIGSFENSFLTSSNSSTYIMRDVITYDQNTDIYSTMVIYDTEAEMNNLPLKGAMIGQVTFKYDEGVMKIYDFSKIYERSNQL